MMKIVIHTPLMLTLDLSSATVYTQYSVFSFRYTSHPSNRLDPGVAVVRDS